MAFDTWINIIVPGSGLSDPISMSATRYFYEKRDIRKKQVEVAEAAFDSALALALSGEGVRVVSEAEWRRISAQAVEPMRREKARLYSEKRRAAGVEMKRRRAEEREAAKAAKAQAESNGHGPEVTDEDLRDAAVEEELSLALADGDLTHEPAGDEEQAR